MPGKHTRFPSQPLCAAVKPEKGCFAYIVLPWQGAAHQSMEAAAVWLTEAARQRAWDAQPLHDALRAFVARQLEALQQIRATSAGAATDPLAELQRQLCGLAAVADMLQRHGLASMLDPGELSLKPADGRGLPPSQGSVHRPCCHEDSGCRRDDGHAVGRMYVFVCRAFQLLAGLPNMLTLQAQARAHGDSSSISSSSSRARLPGWRPGWRWPWLLVRWRRTAAVMPHPCSRAWLLLLGARPCSFRWVLSRGQVLFYWFKVYSFKVSQQPKESWRMTCAD